MRREIISGITLALLFLSMLTLAFNIQAVKADSTQLEIVAPATDIPVSTKFNVDINVSDVTDLYSWQIQLYYDATVLTWVNATLPSGHVFDGKLHLALGPVNLSDYEGTYILYSAGLTGWQPEARFTGSGILCRMCFEAKAASTSNLVFSRPLGMDGNTWLFYDEYPYGDIPFTAIEDSVTAVGVDTRALTATSVNAHPHVVKVDDTVIITGAINVTVADGTPVYLESCSEVPVEGPFEPLATVYTANSQYSYTWTLLDGQWIWWSDYFTLWNIRARWGGDDSYKPATSSAITVKVTRILGDVNGDGKVDGKDITIVSQTFGSYPTHLRWNPLADLNSDNKIDGIDITIVVKDFGKVYVKPILPPVTDSSH